MSKVSDLLSMILPVNNFFSFQSSAASTHADDIDPLFNFLIWSSFGIFLLIVLPVLWFCFRYRKTKSYKLAKSQKDHNNFLEIFWTIIPAIYLSILFVWSFNGYLNLSIPPSNVKEMRIIGQKWMWSITYPDDGINISGQGVVIPVPIEQPIKLIMSSQDVIHSFSVPNFRIKQDVVPGRYSTVWFKANKIGEYPVFCTEYCGDQHSKMLAKIKVVSKSEFHSWAIDQKSSNLNLSPNDLGKKLYSSKGCIACHSINGEKGIAPTFMGMHGKTHALINGKEIKVDDNRIKQKLLNPQKDITYGFLPVMPTFKGQLSEVEIIGIIEYIKFLK